MTVAPLPRLLTEAAVAEYLGVSEPSVARARREGRLAYLRVGRGVRFLPEQVAAYVAGEVPRPPEIQWPNIPILSIQLLRSLPDPAEDDAATTHGVYFLWLAGELVYVGQSADVHSRVWQHIENRENAKDITTSKVFGRALKFDSQRWLSVPWPFHLAVEAAYLHHYRPPENRKLR